MSEHNPWEGAESTKMQYWQRNLTTDLQKPLPEEDRKWTEDELEQIRQAQEPQQSA
jgi:hypothetical protein